MMVLKHVLLVASMLFFALTAAASEPAETSSFSYASGNGEELWFQVSGQADRQPSVKHSSGDMAFPRNPCGVDLKYACVDLGAIKPLKLAVPLDILQRIPETLMEMQLSKDQDRLKLLIWSTGKFEYHVQPTKLFPHGDTTVWQSVGFLDQEVRIIKVVVYEQGKVDRLHPEATFLYSPERGIVAFDYPFGHEQGGIEFRSYWLEQKCGLIPIKPCHGNKAR
jgi:hypothetical protein